mgnify:CR=1 FL=1
MAKADRVLIAKACPKCGQVYSKNKEKCDNEECGYCVLVELYSEPIIKKESP